LPCETGADAERDGEDRPPDRSDRGAHRSGADPGDQQKDQDLGRGGDQAEPLDARLEQRQRPELPMGNAGGHREGKQERAERTGTAMSDHRVHGTDRERDQHAAKGETQGSGKTESTRLHMEEQGLRQPEQRERGDELDLCLGAAEAALDFRSERRTEQQRRQQHGRRPGALDPERQQDLATQAQRTCLGPGPG
jgi:hypothetical protein